MLVCEISAVLLVQLFEGLDQHFIKLAFKDLAADCSVKGAQDGKRRPHLYKNIGQIKKLDIRDLHARFSEEYNIPRCNNRPFIIKQLVGILLYQEVM